MMNIITKETIDQLPVVEHPMPPNFVNLLSGRHVVYPGGGWYLVSEEVTRSDIESRWKRFNKVNVDVPTGNNWVISGSKGNEYTVSFKNMSWGCTCPGFVFRKKCKHIDRVKSDIK